MAYNVEPNVQVAFDALEKNAIDFIDSQKILSAVLQTPAYAGVFIKEKKIPEEIVNKIHPQEKAPFDTLLSQFYTHNPAYTFQLFGKSAQKILLENDNKREGFIQSHQADRQNDNSFEYKTREIDFFVEKMQIFAMRKHDLSMLMALDCFKHQAKQIETSAHELAEAIIVAQPAMEFAA